jgi:hypothetical protein
LQTQPKNAPKPIQQNQPKTNPIAKCKNTRSSSNRQQNTQNRNLPFKLRQIFNHLISFLLTLFRNSLKIDGYFVIKIEAGAEIIFGLNGESVLIARVRLV